MSGTECFLEYHVEHFLCLILSGRERRKFTNLVSHYHFIYSHGLSQGIYKNKNKIVKWQLK